MKLPNKRLETIAVKEIHLKIWCACGDANPGIEFTIPDKQLWNDYDEFFAKDIRVSVLKRIFSKYIKKIASEILKLDYIETPQKYCHVSERSFKDLGEKLSQKEWKEHFEEIA